MYIIPNFGVEGITVCLDMVSRLWDKGGRDEGETVMAYRYHIVGRREKGTGNQSVIITGNDEAIGPFSCRVYVNIFEPFPDATTVACSRKTIKGAIKWARRQLKIAA